MLRGGLSKGGPGYEACVISYQLSVTRTVFRGGPHESDPGYWKLAFGKDACVISYQFSASSGVGSREFSAELLQNH